MADPYIFAQITSTDRAGVVWVASILSLLYSLSTLVARFFVKYHTLGYDDWLILAATVVAFGQYIAVFVSLTQGLGISSLIQAKDVAQNLGSGVLANEILFILAIALTKLSVVFFVKRLLTQELRKAWWAAHVVLGLTVAWAIASVLLVSVGCSPQNAVYEPQTCTGMVCRPETLYLKKHTANSNLDCPLECCHWHRCLPRDLLRRIISGSCCATADESLYQSHRRGSLRIQTSMRCALFAARCSHPQLHHIKRPRSIYRQSSPLAAGSARIRTRLRNDSNTEELYPRLQQSSWSGRVNEIKKAGRRLRSRLVCTLRNRERHGATIGTTQRHEERPRRFCG
jgi:hypothetical protein